MVERITRFILEDPEGLFLGNIRMQDMLDNTLRMTPRPRSPRPRSPGSPGSRRKKKKSKGGTKEKTKGASKLKGMPR